jgi:hypothetical protein
MPPLDLSCTNEEKVPFSVKPKTAGGKPASIDGAVRFTRTSGDGTIEEVGDGVNFFAVSGDAPGGSAWLVEVDADLTPDQPDGSGIKLIQDTIGLNVIGAQAASVGLESGAPVPK